MSGAHMTYAEGLIISVSLSFCLPSKTEVMKSPCAGSQLSDVQINHCWANATAMLFLQRTVSSSELWRKFKVQHCASDFTAVISGSTVTCVLPIMFPLVQSLRRLTSWVGNICSLLLLLSSSGSCIQDFHRFHELNSHPYLCFHCHYWSLFLQ